MSVQTFKYMVQSEGIEYYCKVTETIIRDQISYDFAFGGRQSFCFIACMEHDKNFIPYIDRVEYEPDCVKTGTLEEFGGTAKLVRSALWTMKYLFPHITHFTLLDDSHINCERGVRRHKMSLAYDTIFKSEQTWYEKRFHAKLKDDLMKSYKQSIQVINAPLIPFERILQRYPKMHAYKDEYTQSTTPKKFIDALRKKYGNKYCYEVSDWLSDYAEYLGIKYYKQDWYIESGDLIKPDGYALFLSDAPLRGGMKGKTRRRRRRYTGGRKPSVGYYATFEDLAEKN